MRRLGPPLICLSLGGCAGQTVGEYYLAPPEGPTVRVVPGVAVPVAPVGTYTPGAMPAAPPPAPPLGSLGQPPKPHPAKPKPPAKPASAAPTSLAPKPAPPAAPPAGRPPAGAPPEPPPSPDMPPGLVPLPSSPGG